MTPSISNITHNIRFPVSGKSGSFSRVLLSTAIMTACITPLCAFAELDIIESKGNPVSEALFPEALIEPNLNRESSSVDSVSRSLFKSDTTAHSLQKTKEKPPFLKETLGGLIDFVESKLPKKQLETDSSMDSSSLQTVASLNVPFVRSELSLLDAQQLLTQVSPKLAANNAAIAASMFQSEASEGLNKPIVFLRAQATHYDVNAHIDLTGVKSGVDNKVNGLLSIVPLPIPENLPPPSSIIPDEYNLQRSGEKIGANVVALWPVYSGGRNETLTSILDARTSEAQAEALMDSDVLYTTLVQRYFNAQLAIVASDLREDALHTVEKTDYMAQRLFEEGFIAKVERLEAKVALADAESEAVKASNNAKLAMTALQSLLRVPNISITPTTPLFVSSRPLVSLTEFQKMALANHPVFKKVDAKYQQAQQLQELSDTGFKPTIGLYGLHEIDKDPNWMVGVSASWKLWGGLDKKASIAAGNAKMQQALLTKLEAHDSIMLLVEKNWQTVENARVDYLSLDANVSLAKELLRLKNLGLTEGVNTALDVTTAQTKYLKALTEQAVAANHYVQALAALMESCGTPFAFNDYMKGADIRLSGLY